MATMKNEEFLDLMSKSSYWFTTRRTSKYKSTGRWPFANNFYVENLTNVVDGSYYGASYRNAKFIEAGKLQESLLNKDLANHIISGGVSIEEREAYSLLVNGFNANSVLGKLRNSSINAALAKREVAKGNQFVTDSTLGQWAKIGAEEEKVSVSDYLNLLKAERTFKNPAIFTNKLAMGDNSGFNFDAYAAPKLEGNKDLNSFAHMNNIENFDNFIQEIAHFARIDIREDSSLEDGQTAVKPKRFFGALNTIKKVFTRKGIEKTGWPTRYVLSYSANSTQADKTYAIIKRLAQISVEDNVEFTQKYISKHSLAVNLPKISEFDVDKKFIANAVTSLVASELCYMLRLDPKDARTLSDAFKTEAICSLEKVSNQNSTNIIPLIADYHAYALNGFAKDFLIDPTNFMRQKGLREGKFKNFGSALYAKFNPEVEFVGDKDYKSYGGFVQPTRSKARSFIDALNSEKAYDRFLKERKQEKENKLIADGMVELEKEYEKQVERGIVERSIAEFFKNMNKQFEQWELEDDIRRGMIALEKQYENQVEKGRIERDIAEYFKNLDKQFEQWEIEEAIKNGMIYITEKFYQDDQKKILEEAKKAKEESQKAKEEQKAEEEQKPEVKQEILTEQKEVMKRYEAPQDNKYAVKVADRKSSVDTEEYDKMVKKQAKALRKMFNKEFFAEAQVPEYRQLFEDYREIPTKSNEVAQRIVAEVVNECFVENDAKMREFHDIIMTANGSNADLRKKMDVANDKAKMSADISARLVNAKGKNVGHDIVTEYFANKFVNSIANAVREFREQSMENYDETQTLDKPKYMGSRFTISTMKAYLRNLGSKVVDYNASDAVREAAGIDVLKASMRDEVFKTVDQFIEGRNVVPSGGQGDGKQGEQRTLDSF